LGIRKRRAFGTRKDGRRYPKPGYVHDSTRVKKLVRAVAEYARVTPEQVIALAKIRAGPSGGHVLAVFKMPGGFIDVRTEVDGKVYRSVIDKKGRFAAVTAEMGHAGLTREEEDREEVDRQDSEFRNYQMGNEEGKRIDDYEAKK
jgi:ribosomal protein S4E